MSASTPPTLNNETRLPLPEECHIPLPPSPTLSAQDAKEDEQYDEGYSSPKPTLPLPLLELLHAIQEDKYESRRLAVLQDEAYGLFHKCGSCDRFLTVQAQLYKSMMDCFRNEKKSAFASLYTKAMSYPAFGELRIRGPVLNDDSDNPTEISWIDRLPSDSRIALMDFLHRLRHDPDFVANRISRLSSKQLKKLIQSHIPFEPGPIFRSQQSQGRYDGRNIHRGGPKSNEADVSVDELLSDPLLLMVHGVFDANHSERSYQIDIWSSVCAKLVEDGKPGSDDFCITIMNLFVNLPDWNATPKLELFLSDLVTAGGPFLEAGGHNNKSTHPQQRDTGVVTSSFLEPYIPRLLDLLSSSPAPSQALDLVRAILAKISDLNRKVVARNIFFSRWYCNSFLANALIYPETHGVLMEHHINASLRQKVLREVLSRIQSIVSHVLSPWPSNHNSNTLENKVQDIFALFEQDGQFSTQKSSPSSSPRCFLFLRSEDVLSMARSLIPAESDSSATSILEQLHSSSSSSVLAFQNQSRPRILGSFVYPGPNGISMNQTWHGSRPAIDSGYSTMGKNSHPPSSSGDTMGDSEKHEVLPFIQDLWVLTANRDFQSPGSTKHEVAVIFTPGDGSNLSLDPFTTNINPVHTHEPSIELSLDGQKLLTAAVLRLAQHTTELEQNYSCIFLASLEGLATIFQDKARETNDAFDFQAEYFWWQCLEVLRNTNAHMLTMFLSSLANHRKMRIAYKRELAKQYDDWLHTLRTRSTLQDLQNHKLSLSSKRLRNKMWFTSDVRHSSAYEDACNVVRALRAMLEPAEPRQPGVTGWAKQRFRSSSGQERVMAQLLELMTAPKTYGGPNKLSENQVEITSGWLLHDNIENFCRGEERIHRFCYEIQKCVKRLAGEAMLDSPVLWSSPLYSNEKTEYGITGQSKSHHQQDRPTWRTDFSYPQWSTPPNLPVQLPFSGSEVVAPGTSPTRSMFDRSLPTSFSPMLPPNSLLGATQGPRNWMLPPSPISPGNVKVSHDGATLRRRSFLQNLKTHLTSLLLSDLGSQLWNDGSETDQWISLLDRTRRRSPVLLQETFDSDGRYDRLSTQNAADSGLTAAPSFSFTESYQTLLQRFELTSNPQTKLKYLHELFVLVNHAQNLRKRDQLDQNQQEQKTRVSPLGNLGIGIGVPRTRLTRLQEVAANCEDRRISSISNSGAGPVLNPDAPPIPNPAIEDSELIAAVQEIFEDPTYRPSAFFRDLQYIAAFTPSSILDYTSQGTAFWTIGLAAMRIKSEKSKIMTDNAMQILDFHYGNGSKKEPVRAGQSSPRQGSTSTGKLSEQDLLSTSLKDAARLLTISALEGDPTAARELALFHLTHPELVSRVTLPLSRPSDVFRVNRNGNEEPVVLDSVTFAVVFHWMEFAANAGDADAITFFKENKDLGKAL